MVVCFDKSHFDKVAGNVSVDPMIQIDTNESGDGASK